MINPLLSYYLANFLILGMKSSDRFACVTGSLVNYVTFIVILAGLTLINTFSLLRFASSRLDPTQYSPSGN